MDNGGEEEGLRVEVSGECPVVAKTWGSFSRQRSRSLMGC